MATKEQIDALQIGDKLEIHIEAMGGKWYEVVLAPRHDPDGKTHLAVLIEQWGYGNLRLPGE